MKGYYNIRGEKVHDHVGLLPALHSYSRPQFNHMKRHSQLSPTHDCSFVDVCCEAGRGLLLTAHRQLFRLDL